MVFRSKVDGWLVWVVRLPMLAGLVLVALSAIRQPNGLTITILAGFVVVYAVVEWILGSTYYTVDQDFLRIRSGPYRTRLLISDIRSITRSSNPLAAPALSLDRLEIRDGNGRSVLVSPHEDELFVESLRSINNSIEYVSS